MDERERDEERERRRLAAAVARAPRLLGNAPERALPPRAEALRASEIEDAVEAANEATSATAPTGSLDITDLPLPYTPAGDIAQLQEDVTRLREEVAALREEVRALRQRGESAP